MPRAPVPTAAAASGARGARVPVLATLGLLTGGARAELLGTHPHRRGTVQLTTALCREDDPGAGQRARQTARQTVGGRERLGCWDVDPTGDPVVTWSDGSELALDGDKVRLSRRMAALLEKRAESLPPRAPAPAATLRVRTRAEAPGAATAPPARSGAAPRDSVRPAWCPDARFPHERLVCTDAELADRDLRLASLWRPYRRSLSRGAETWHKSDYFRRLKACGADKACIGGEQGAQLRRYREGLPAGHQDRDAQQPSPLQPAPG